MNNKTTADAVPEFFKQDNIDVFVKQGVYTEREVVARAKISLENYIKTIDIEAHTLIEMAKRDVYPAVNGYIAEVCSVIAAKRAVSEKIVCAADEELAQRLAVLNDGMAAAVKKLETDLLEMPAGESAASQKMAHVIVPDMEAVRTLADAMEQLTSAEYWPYPTYADIMYSVK